MCGILKLPLNVSTNFFLISHLNTRKDRKRTVTNMERRFPAMLVLWLEREFYKAKHGVMDFGCSGTHIYKPYPDRTEAGNQSISLATRSSDVVFSSRTTHTAIITEQESS
ncbi:hypothetical protein AVEN_96730-1 [Araneus ventricosus]|uniref:Uncharacterized protein n=1 Tax=Araneus ventricosus TaxID=182803 RepID=A0A4Y2VKZ7_ARAVE|nr:hypothetical protein AVEN_117540-1 [Araneus ventricosus]GBO24846.1 hypothetical protein AVEN_96730-1 [Araneus ventricosus]